MAVLKLRRSLISWLFDFLVLLWIRFNSFGIIEEQYEK